MPDEYDDPDDGDPDESSVIRDLRAKARRTAAAEAERDALRKELAIARTGLDLNEKQTKALLAAHGDGELTKEALLETAVDIKLAEPPAETETPQVPPEDQQAHQQTREAFNGAEGAEARQVTLEDRINGAKSADEVKQILAEAGMASDYGDAPSE